MSTESVGDQINCEERIFTPEVDNDKKPYKGQHFSSLEEVHQFYNNYAKEAGFSVRIHSSRRNRSGDDIIRKEFVCFKQGFKDGFKASMNSTELKRRRGDVRMGCEAKLAVVKSKTSGYEVSIFVEHHTHVLSTPSRIHLLRSHRAMSSAQKCLSQQLDAINIPPSQQMGLFEVQAGGLQNVGCLQSDIYNNRRNERLVVKGRDADMLYEYFQEEKEKNPSFFFTIKTGDENRFKHCFWADSLSRRAYEIYGDVVVFDTTYNTNRYGLVFAPIVGVNNHRQTILLGAAFLSDETSDSFEWLFQQFKEAMIGFDPKMIITDQDAAMAKAISNILPYTYHRLCIWHILNKFSEKLGPIVYGKYFRDFETCIWETYSIDEFETMWRNVITKAKLEDHVWLQGMYDIRSKWVPIYMKHVFAAGMSSSQRVESNHTFFKRYISKDNSLIDFMLRFNRAVSRQRHEELIADNKDMVERPLLKLPVDMEKQMSEIYTREIFYKFQTELWNSMKLKGQIVSEDEHCWGYNVVGERVFQVQHQKNSELVSCICKMFESEGIPCRHILYLLVKKLEIDHLPDVYILRRWTKAARIERNVYDVGINNCSDNSILFRRTMLFQHASNVIDKAVFNDESSKILTEHLDMAMEKIKSLSVSGSSGGQMEKNSYVEQHRFNEPHQVRTKGSGKRIKSRKEMSKKKNVRERCCSCCGQIGHDKRNCHLKSKRSIDVEEQSTSSSSSNDGVSFSEDNAEEILRLI